MRKHECDATKAALAGCLGASWAAVVWYFAVVAYCYIDGISVPWARGVFGALVGSAFYRLVMIPLYRMKYRRSGTTCPDCYSPLEVPDAD